MQQRLPKFAEKISVLNIQEIFHPADFQLAIVALHNLPIIRPLFVVYVLQTTWGTSWLVVLLLAALRYKFISLYTYLNPQNLNLSPASGDPNRLVVYLAYTLCRLPIVRLQPNIVAELSQNMVSAQLISLTRD